MKLSAKDRRALSYLALSLALSAVYYFWPSGEALPAVAASPESIEVTEQRLERLRRIAAALPAKEDILKQVSADLATRESGLIRAQTAAQAQAQMFTMLQRLGSEEAPPIEVRQTELGAVAPLGEAYGSASLTVQFECRMHQLVNFLSSVAAQPELISTQDLQINASNAKQKTVRVRLTVIGVIPRELVPARKGAG
jgi:hypothetical protein